MENIKMKVKQLENKEEYLEQQDPIDRDINFNYAWLPDILIHTDIKAKKNPYILDIGCKSGRLVYDLMGNKFFNTYGIDIGKRISKQWIADEDHFILEDIQERIPFKHKWDLIIMSHVLEHLYKPKEVMLKLKERLKYDGEIYIELPLNEDYPAHYTIFTSEFDLIRFLIQCGYKLKYFVSYEREGKQHVRCVVGKDIK